MRSTKETGFPMEGFLRPPEYVHTVTVKPSLEILPNVHGVEEIWRYLAQGKYHPHCNLSESKLGAWPSQLS